MHSMAPLRKKNILRSVHWKVLWETKNSSSKASLQKKTFGSFVFLKYGMKSWMKYNLCCLTFWRPVVHLESFLEEWSTCWDSSRHTAAPEPDCPTPGWRPEETLTSVAYLHRFSLTLPCINGKTSKLLDFISILNSTRSRNLPCSA